MKIIIVIPCYNEEKVLEENIKKILDAVRELPYDFEIVISDNNSKDGTGEIGKRLAREFGAVDYVFVGEQGKGAAVFGGWKGREADIYGFMDADLATDLGVLRSAIETINSSPLYSRGRLGGGFYNIIIGSRRIPGAKVKREWYRKMTSWGLNLLVRILLRTKIRDTACGFKFFRREVLDKILSQVKDRAWTFDTEMLILAERAGFKIKEIPVRWEERGDSKVLPKDTIFGYLRKIISLM